MENSVIIFSSALAVGALTGYLGSLIVTKRMALVGDALGHVALPGVAFAILYNFNIIWGALASLALGILIIWALERGTKLPTEALTGVIFTVSLAAAFLLIPGKDLEEALIGNLSSLKNFEALWVIVISILVFFVIRAVFSSLVLIALSEDLAKTQKVRTGLLNFIYLASVGVIVVLGLRFVGSLLTGALLIVPALTARIVSRSARGYVYGSMAFGVISAGLGILIGEKLALPFGPMTILTSSSFFLLALVCKRLFIKQ